jgi:hypothetical protein
LHRIQRFRRRKTGVFLSLYWYFVVYNSPEASFSKKKTVSGIIGSALILNAIKLIVFYVFCLLATKALHNKMLNSVIATKIRFFDLNPIGRVINRFSKDVGIVDFILPLCLHDVLQVKQP